MTRHPATSRRVSYALGYLGLGMWKEAALELESIVVLDQSLPEVLSVRIDFYLEAKEWDKLVETGSRLAKSHPAVEGAWIGWAYALREMSQVEEARQVLLEAEMYHGRTSAVMHYNLACYESLLGAIPSARARFATACRMDKRFVAEGKRDPDLKSLRDAEAGIK